MSLHLHRILAPLALLALTAAALACGFAPSAAPPAASPATTHAAPSSPARTLVQRGEYLVLVGACDDCHTPGTLFGQPDMSRRFSGSELPWGGPWGVTYGRNITSDPETGIGNWTEEQVHHALKHGVRPDGSVLLPPMPWQRLAEIEDEDVRAIAAYLKTVPPVRHAVPPALPPGSAMPEGTVRFPPPPAWDAPRSPVATGQ